MPSKRTFRRAHPSKEFVLRNLGLLILGPVIALIVAAILWSMVFSILEEDRNLRERQASSQAVALAKSYSLYLARTIQQFDQLSKQVKYGWEREGASHFFRMLQDGLFRIEYLNSIVVFDRNGKPIIGNLSIEGAAPIQDRDYFQFHQTNTSAELHIGTRRIGRYSGQEIVTATRRLNDAYGNFDGVLLLGLKPELFTLFRHEAVLGEGGIMAFVGDDGTERVWKGHFSSDVLQHLKANSSSESRFISPFTKNEHHYFAVEPVEGYPFVALVGLDRTKVMLAHASNARSYHRVAFLVSMILVFVAGLSAWAAISLHWRKQQADALNESYRVATEGGNEGFFILIPIRNRDRQIVDFEIVDCNERGAAFFGMTSDHLVGNNIRDMYSDRHLQALIDTCTMALETGYYEDVFHVPQESRAKVEWLSRKFVRSGNGLSVTIRDISDAKRHETEMSKRATLDGLTALHNRHWMMNHLPIALQRAAQEETMLALLFIDLDNFKHINDAYGHAAGDDLLCDVAMRMKSVIRSTDKVIRLGGDEFTVVLESIHHENEVASIAQALTDAIGRPFDIRLDANTTKQDRVGASIGISLYPKDGIELSDLMQKADIAMYAAKNAGKGSHRFYDDDLNESLNGRRHTEKLLQQAVLEDHFVIHYQPRIHTSDGTLAGMEALVRWQHPERGLVLPASFIRLIDDLGLAQKMGNLVLEKVCAQIADWRRAGYEPLPVSINIGTQQFADGDLQRTIRSLLEHHDLPASLLEIEVTEAVFQDNQIDIARELNELHAIGITIHIDDFGTGYSSLPQLHRLHARLLKIDEGFTAQLGRSKDGEVFFRAIISMSRALGMIVVAEGVETGEQLKILQLLGCDQVQGSYIARALPADIVRELFSQSSLF